MRTAEGTSRPADKHRLLVVDDNALLARVITELFSIEGFQVEIATDGDAALACFRERGPFDVVICDVLLPGMRGTDVAHAILREHPGTGFILWSGQPAEAVLGEGDIPRARFVQKPLDAQQLLRLVAEVLAERS
jgi:DNA-binding NtrC family response regulator